MKRRFQIAKALVHDPDILILDEPTAGVDVELRRDLWDYLKELHSSGKTILLTTHYIEEAELLCENIAIIDQGKILKKGTPKDLTKEYGSAVISISSLNIKNSIKSFVTNYKYIMDDNQINFSVKDPELALPEIIQSLTTSGIQIQKIETNKSSLEDVFLDLTGKRLNK